MAFLLLASVVVCRCDYIEEEADAAAAAAAVD